MISGSSNRRCVKCGHVLPPDAGFCPHCGTAAHDVTFVPASEHGPATFLPDSSPRAVTPLPIPQMPPIDAAGNPTMLGAQPAGGNDAPTIKQTVALPSSIGQAVTISPTGVSISIARTVSSDWPRRRPPPIGSTAVSPSRSSRANRPGATP